MTAIIASADVRLSLEAIANFYPRGTPDDGPRPLSWYMVERLPEPVRELVMDRMRGRRDQVEAVLVTSGPCRFEVLVRNRQP